MRSPDRSNAGFTVVEMMIALALTATVVSLAITGFQNLSDAGDGGSLTTDLNVNLRSTLNLMSRDLIRAGSRNIPVGGIPLPFGSNSVAIIRPSVGDALTFPQTETLPAVSPGDALGARIGTVQNADGTTGLATDIINILTTDQTLALDQYKLTNIAADFTSVTVDPRTPIGNASTGITAGDLIWLKNGVGQTLVMVTSIAGQTITFAPGDPMHLNQPNSFTGNVKQLLQEFEPGPDPNNPETGGTWTVVNPQPDTYAVRVLMISYYIDNSDPTKPKLMRRINMREPRTIGVVVENLQLTYDIADGGVSQANLASPTEPNQIRKANLFVAGRSHREWRRTHDYLRTYVATQISLRSLAFVDRYNQDDSQ